MSSLSESGAALNISPFNCASTPAGCVCEARSRAQSPCVAGTGTAWARPLQARAWGTWRAFARMRAPVMPQRGLAMVGSTLRPTTRQLLSIGLAYVLVVSFIGPYFHHRLSPHASPRHASPQTRSQTTW
jgi:hypothetical protein